ncbi:hypothetical protein Esti_006469 [Eimeria stiedai]
MAGCPGGPMTFAFSSLEPVVRLHSEMGIAAVPYSPRRSTLELDSFVHLHAEKRSDPWSSRRKLRSPSRASEAAAPAAQDHESKREGLTDYAKRRALATYVLGVEPPSGATRAGPLRRTRRHSVDYVHPSCESSWGSRSAGASVYGLSYSHGDENAVGAPRGPPPAEGAPGRPPWRAPHHLVWCSNVPGCCCANCSEEVVAARKRERQPFGVSKNPYRVLDAPNLPDDFYLNLVDWSLSDCVAVGIRGSVLLWNAKTAATEVMFAKTAATPRLGQRRLTHACTREPLAREVANVSFSPLDPSILCVGFRSGTIELWDVREKKLIRTLTGHKTRCAVSAWSKQQMLLWTGARDQTILTRDLRCQDPFVSTFAFHQSELCGLDLSPSENLLASGANDNLLCIWDLRGTINQRPRAPTGMRAPRISAFDWWGAPAAQTTAFTDAFSFRLPQSFLPRSAAGGGGASSQGPLVGALRAPSSFVAGEGPPRRSSLQQPGWGPPVQSLTQGDPCLFGGAWGSSPSADISFDSSSEMRVGRSLGCEDDEVLSDGVSRNAMGRRSPPTLTTTSTTRSTPEQTGTSSEAPSNSSSPLSASQVSPALYPSLSPLTAAASQQHQQQQQQAPRSSSRTQLDERQRAARGVTTAPLCVYNEHKAAIKAVKFCPHTDALLASGGGTADRHIRFWNPTIGGSRSVFGVDTGCQVCNIAFSLHSQSFISTHGFSLNQIFLWDYSSSAWTSSPPEPESQAGFSSSLLDSLLPQREIEAVGGADPVRRTATLSGHSSRVLFLAASPCGSCVVSGAGRGDETLKFWKVFKPAEESEVDCSFV